MVRSRIPAPHPAAPAAAQIDCRRCGACCAFFRVSFYWNEPRAVALPDRLVERISPWHVCLAGTNRPAPRCQALAGELGRQVHCTVYAQRPQPCRELHPGDDKCLRARRGHGLSTIAAKAAPRRVGEPTFTEDADVRRR